MSLELDAKIEELRVDIAESDAGIDSAIAFISGVNQIITDLRAELIRTGVRPEQLTALTAFGVALDAKKDALAAALVAAPPA